MRKKGLADISYCDTKCTQEDCERSLRVRKPPRKHYSVYGFDKNETDELHPHCKYKYTRGEDQ